MTSEDELAWINGISAQQGFAEGDPRSGPFDEVQAAEAKSYLKAPDRWHRLNGCDLYAVRLQYGRGVRRKQVAQMFSIGDTLIGDRKVLAHGARWISNMSERDRRDLSRKVWIGGLQRRFETGGEVDEALLASLKTASAWARFEAETHPVWMPQDTNGEALPMTLHSEMPDDAHYGHDAGREPDHNQYADLWARLEAELDAIDAATSDGDDGRSARGEAAEDAGREAARDDDRHAGEVPAHADLHGPDAGQAVGEAVEAVGA